MTKNQGAELIHLTQQCWERYWQLDLDFMLSHCDENVSWIGAEQDEFIIGFENVKQNFADLLHHLRSCYLLNQEFYVTQSSKNVFTVMGRYFVTTDESNDYFLQVLPRVKHWPKP